MQLPEDFINYTRPLMGDEQFNAYLRSFTEEVPVSIRLNPLKLGTDGSGRHQAQGQPWLVVDGEPVPWCTEGYYLPRRPQFTMDPLLHAGCYYVQEAASMFVTHILRQLFTEEIVNSKSVNSKSVNSKLLDLCAAPGGKSTAAIAAMPPGTTLYSNEPIRQRASILLENITKWGYPGCTVTNSYPKDYRRSGLTFDIILCDVPCSGEGMFRRDPATIGEWSLQQVEKCWRLQRDIVSDAWACLKPGGVLIYSTCTFNTKENEENVRWMLTEFGDAEIVPIAIEPQWHITGSLLEGFTEPVYRFIPGITRSEGLFVAVLRKAAKEGSNSNAAHLNDKKSKSPKGLNILTPPIESPARPTGACYQGDARISKAPLNQQSLANKETQESSIFNLQSSIFNASYSQAIAYLRGEALQLPPDVPRGPVAVAFQGHTLGTVKNIGSRANNQYPKEWRIKTTHVPQDYEPVLIKESL